MANSQDKIFSTAPSNLQVQFNASSTASEAAESTSQGTLYATPHGLYLNKQLIAQDTFSAFQTKGKTAEYSSVNVSVAAATNQDTLTLEFGNGLVVGADDTNDHITVNLKNAGVPLISTVIDSNNYLNGSLDVHPVTDQYYLVYVDAAKKVSGAGYSMKLTYAGGTQTCTLAVTQNNGTTTGSLVSITPGIHIVRFTNFTATESGTFSGTVDFLDSWQVVKAATAETAEKLSTSAGSAIQPVYFDGGKPVATTYTLNATVPAGAKFTDTTYSAATTSAAGLMSSADKAKLDGIAANANNYSLPTATEDTLGGVMIGTGLSMQTGHIMNAGVRSISTGNTDGTISVNTNGDSAEVAVKGLAAAAYKGVDTTVTKDSTNLITSGAVNSALGSYIMGNAKGAKGGIASLDEDGKVPSSQLPQASTTVAGITKLTNSLEAQYSDLPATAGAVANELATLKNSYLPDNYIKSSLRGEANGVAPLNDSGLIDSTYLPSYVDDVVEGYYLKYGTTYAFFTQNTADTQYLINAETGKIYVDLNTNKTYRWGGSSYVEISESLAIGTTEGTAFSGKTGNDHVNNTNNPHSVTKAQVGLGNVDNTADADKSVLSASIAFCDGALNVITNTYLRKDAVQTSTLDGKSTTQVPSVSLVYNETVKVWTGTQAEYDALESYDSRTAYLITDASETVYSDMDFGSFYSSSITGMTNAKAFEFYTVLVTNGIAKKKQVYMHCTYSTTAEDSGYHLIRYDGRRTVGSQKYEVFSCFIDGAWLEVGLMPTSANLATWTVINQSRPLTASDAKKEITSSSTDSTVPTSKAVYGLVSPLITQLTWQ